MLSPRIHLLVACSLLLTACGTNPNLSERRGQTVIVDQPVALRQADAEKRVYIAQLQQPSSTQQANQQKRRQQEQKQAKVQANAAAKQAQQAKAAAAQARQQAQQRQAEIKQRQQAQQRQAEAEKQRARQEAEKKLARQRWKAKKRQLEQEQAKKRAQAKAQQQLAARRAQNSSIATPPRIKHYEQQRQQQQRQRQQQQQLAQRRTVTAASTPTPLRRSASRMFTGRGKLNRLPDTIASSLKLRGLPSSNMSVYVRPASARGPALVTAKADVPRNPASAMKLVTTYAALGTLGDNYRWPTELYINGNVRGGTLYGDVILKGYGDPAFHEDDFLSLLQALRNRGIRKITGNFVADTTFFNIPYQDPGAFDGRPKAAYNAQPEALLYQERGSCYEFTNLKGQIEKICPVMPRNAKARNDLNTNIFGGFWKLWVGKLRGRMDGHFVRAKTPRTAQLVHTHRSEPLREVIVEINKSSNNVMARQLMLSVGAKQLGVPGTPKKGAAAIGQWLESRGLKFPELRLENGSGLSRIERISARHLGEMLVDAYNSPHRQAFVDSLAVMGVDGTLRNRLKKSSVKGRGQFKTGTLRNVRSLAGYVTAADGQVYVVSILHNDSRARSRARNIHDDLVEWVYWGSRKHFAGL